MMTMCCSARLVTFEHCRDIMTVEQKQAVLSTKRLAFCQKHAINSLRHPAHPEIAETAEQHTVVPLHHSKPWPASTMFPIALNAEVPHISGHSMSKGYSICHGVMAMRVSALPHTSSKANNMPGPAWPADPWP